MDHDVVTPCTVERHLRPQSPNQETPAADTASDRALEQVATLGQVVAAAAAAAYLLGSAYWDGVFTVFEARWLDSELPSILRLYAGVNQCLQIVLSVTVVLALANWYPSLFKKLVRMSAGMGAVVAYLIISLWLFLDNQMWFRPNATWEVSMQLLTNVGVIVGTAIVLDSSGKRSSAWRGGAMVATCILLLVASHTSGKIRGGLRLADQFRDYPQIQLKTGDPAEDWRLLFSASGALYGVRVGSDSSNVPYVRRFSPDEVVTIRATRRLRSNRPG